MIAHWNQKETSHISWSRGFEAFIQGCSQKFFLREFLNFKSHHRRIMPKNIMQHIYADNWSWIVLECHNLLYLVNIFIFVTSRDCLYMVVPGRTWSAQKRNFVIIGGIMSTYYSRNRSWVVLVYQNCWNLVYKFMFVPGLHYCAWSGLVGAKK